MPAADSGAPAWGYRRVTRILENDVLENVTKTTKLPGTVRLHAPELGLSRAFTYR